MLIKIKVIEICVNKKLYTPDGVMVVGDQARRVTESFLHSFAQGFQHH